MRLGSWVTNHVGVKVKLCLTCLSVCVTEPAVCSKMRIGCYEPVYNFTQILDLLKLNFEKSYGRMRRKWGNSPKHSRSNISGMVWVRLQLTTKLELLRSGSRGHLGLWPHHSVHNSFFQILYTNYRRIIWGIKLTKTAMYLPAIELLLRRNFVPRTSYPVLVFSKSKFSACQSLHIDSYKWMWACSPTLV